MTDAVRFTLTIPADIVEQVNELKRDKFYDKPYAELYRYLIELGIKATTLVNAKEG